MTTRSDDVKILMALVEAAPGEIARAAGDAAAGAYFILLAFASGVDAVRDIATEVLRELGWDLVGLEDVADAEERSRMGTLNAPAQGALANLRASGEAQILDWHVWDSTS